MLFSRAVEVYPIGTLFAGQDNDLPIDAQEHFRLPEQLPIRFYLPIRQRIKVAATRRSSTEKESSAHNVIGFPLPVSQGPIKRQT